MLLFVWIEECLGPQVTFLSLNNVYVVGNDFLVYLSFVVYVVVVLSVAVFLWNC